MNKTILLVDDNEVNLELISVLIQQYTNENKIEIDLLSAINGQEAIDICSEKTIDIIFMDLMMPVMDGAEATKIIKAKYPHIMVIVISSLGDEEKQKDMLINGAEDYMTKPVSGPLFTRRLHNYLQLIQTRNHISHSAKAYNLFTSKVYNYHMDFLVSNEAQLSEFWEALLIRFDFQRQIDELSDFIRFIYRLGTLQLSQNFQFHIILEEDAYSFFFTLDAMHMFGCKKINEITQKYFENGVYLCKDNKLSFVLQKVSLFEGPSSSVPQEIKDTEIALDYISTPEELRIFDILEPDELDDFEEHLLKLRSLILLMENSNLEHNDIQTLCNSFSEMASILAIPNDTYVLSNALKELSTAISNNEQFFLESSVQLFDFINAFMNDLVFWKTKIFYEGAPSVNFLNDSITSNANMLNALLQPESGNSCEEDVDDIFDF